MSLADACHDEVLAIAEARERGNRDLVIDGVRELMKYVKWYAQPALLDPTGCTCRHSCPNSSIVSSNGRRSRLNPLPTASDA